MSGLQAGPIAQDDFAENVIPPEMEDTGKIIRRLEAWHKPRKQLVRRGWRDNVQRLMKELKFPVGAERVIRYFTLPAPEMLDVRTLEEAAREKEFKIQYVGFTNARGAVPTTIANSSLAKPRCGRRRIGYTARRQFCITGWKS